MEPPGTGTLADQVKAIQKRLAEQGRVKDVKPVAQVRLTGNADYPSGQDVWAGNLWAPHRDNTGMVHIGGLSYIEINVSGWYQVHYHASFDPAGTASAIKVARSPSTADAVATDAASNPPYGADGTVLDAYRPHVYLPSGERLYWAAWSSNNCTLKASTFTVPTEITVMYLHS